MQISLTGELLLQSSFLIVVLMATRLHVLPSSLPTDTDKRSVIVTHKRTITLNILVLANYSLKHVGRVTLHND